MLVSFGRVQLALGSWGSWLESSLSAYGKVSYQIYACEASRGRLNLCAYKYVCGM